jgi:phage/plasmid-like protein (TIGR03299 family)
MSHEVESMAWVGQKPWHELGKEVTDPEVIVSPVKFLEAAGLNWTVRLEPLQTINSFPHVQLTVDHKAVLRSTDNAVLGVVGPRYQPLQNEAAFKWFSPFLESGAAQFEAGGALKEGAIVWALARVISFEQVVGQADPVRGYILLSHGHDGSQCVRAGFTVVRVVCWNTLCGAFSDAASKLIRFKHTKNLEDNLANVREIMDLASGEFRATADEYRKLYAKGISRADVKAYVRDVLELPQEDAKVSTRGLNQAGRVEELVYMGKGNIGRTWWDAYNGVTEYLTHEAGRSADSRLRSAWFGASEKTSKRAFDLAVERVAV